MPVTNLGLKDDASLKLFLSSVNGVGEGARRRVLFDEYFHGVPNSLADYTHGLPLTQIAVQIALIALLLVLSFGRRNGPVRFIARLPRTSPIEFAESMGQLYRKARATQVATECARRRLMHFLVQRCAIPRSILQDDSAVLAEALGKQFAGDWKSLADHLAQAAEAQYQSLAPRSALALVKALDHDLATLTELTMHSHQP
jgi:hypothetical protein